MKNEERVSATRAKLIEAAIEALAEIGYHRTTFVEVSRRSDLSRGAIHHHFDSVPDLMSAVLETIAQIIEENINSAVQRVPTDTSVWASAIDFGWSMVQAQPHLALGQIRTAIASDAALRERVRDQVIRVDRWIHEQAKRVVTPPAGQAEVDDALIRIVLTSLTGAAIRDHSLGAPADDPEREFYLTRLKSMAQTAASAAG